MYESSVNQILGEMQTTYENECIKYVQSVGFDINKEELTKALIYDRNQYEKGHKDGYENAIEKYMAALCDKCVDKRNESYVFECPFCDIYNVAKQLKS